SNQGIAEWQQPVCRRNRDVPAWDVDAYATRVLDGDLRLEVLPALMQQGMGDMLLNIAPMGFDMRIQIAAVAKRRVSEFRTGAGYPPQAEVFAGVGDHLPSQLLLALAIGGKACLRTRSGRRDAQDATRCDIGQRSAPILGSQWLAVALKIVAY